ncbi:41421_t:CDS:2, partial [Gigaspora margarita]
QVCFAYQAGQPVLEQSDLTWKQGKVNRLTGPNGSGQKQLADLNNLFAVSPAKEIFIFDEADNALDTSNRQEFRKKITAL